MKNIKRSLMAIVAILLATTIFLFTSCSYIMSNISDKISEASEQTSIPSIISSDGGSYGDYVLSKNIDSISKDDTTIYIDDEADIYSFIISSIAFDISELGFTDIFEAVAVDELGNTYTGIAFLDGGTYEIDGVEMPTGGFLQLVDDKTDFLLTTAAVEGGVVAVVDEEIFCLVDKFVQLEDFSGIVNDHYFYYKQASPYTMSIHLEELTQTTKLDYSIDLYDFDNGMTKWKADPSQRPSLEAYALYSDEVKAYNSVCEALRQLLEIQEKNGYQNQKMVLTVIDPAVLNAIELGQTQELINNFSVEAINGLEIGPDQLIRITLDGIEIVTIPNVEQASQQRISSGLIQILSSVLLLGGSLAITICTCGAGAPTLVAAASITLTGVVALYSVGQIIEGIDNIVLGSSSDIFTQAYNPIKQQFINAFGSNGETIYHVVGISAMVLQSCLLPITAGLNISSSIGAGVGQTAVILLRATAVHLIETALTIGVSTLASIGAYYLVENWTGNQIAAEWSGLLAGLTSGILTGNGLSALDKQFNFSGLNTKADILQMKFLQNEKKTIEQFRPENWSKLSESAKKNAVKQLAKFIGKDMGLDEIPKIKYYTTDSDEYGFFLEKDYSININTKYMHDSAELIDTLGHELQHAFQFQCINKGVLNDVTWSYLHYISSEESLSGYYNQACERQSFATGQAWKNYAKNVWENKKLDWGNIRSSDGKTAIEHILDNHTYIKSTKSEQGVFNATGKEEISSIIEKGWALRGTPRVEGTNLVYDIPLENIGLVYKNGNFAGVANGLRIVVFDETFLVTAYPVIM